MILTAVVLALLGALDPLAAPIPPTAPTIGSEIRRGGDAAFDCDMHYGGAQQDDVDAYYRCIEDAASTNRQRQGQGFAAFDAGLYYRAKQRLEIIQQVWSRPSVLAHDMVGLGLTIESVSAGYVAALAGIHVKDDDVRRALL